jgi:hypothetical protein
MPRWFCLLALLALLPSCGSFPEPFVAAGLAEVASVTIFQRSMADLIVSGVTGRDCSVVHLDRGQTYCRQVEAPPSPPPYCTRTLGVAQCWTDSFRTPDQPVGLADGPTTLTPAQEANRTRHWPELGL